MHLNKIVSFLLPTPTSIAGHRLRSRCHHCKKILTTTTTTTTTTINCWWSTPLPTHTIRHQLSLRVRRSLTTLRVQLQLLLLSPSFILPHLTKMIFLLRFPFQWFDQWNRMAHMVCRLNSFFHIVVIVFSSVVFSTFLCSANSRSRRVHIQPTPVVIISQNWSLPHARLQYWTNDQLIHALCAFSFLTSATTLGPSATITNTSRRRLSVSWPPVYMRVSVCVLVGCCVLVELVCAACACWCVFVFFCRCSFSLRVTCTLSKQEAFSPKQTVKSHTRVPASLVLSVASKCLSTHTHTHTHTAQHRKYHISSSSLSQLSFSPSLFQSCGDLIAPNCPRQQNRFPKLISNQNYALDSKS